MTVLHCPDCGGTRFSWVLEQVQFGTMHEYDNGHRAGEGMKMGDVVGSDDETPFCVTCDERKDATDLVTPEAVDPADLDVGDLVAIEDDGRDVAGHVADLTTEAGRHGVELLPVDDDVRRSIVWDRADRRFLRLTRAEA